MLAVSFATLVVAILIAGILAYYGNSGGAHLVLSIGAVAGLVLALTAMDEARESEADVCRAGGGEYITTQQGKLVSHDCFKVVDGKIAKVD
jgi:hypothetical protein